MIDGELYVRTSDNAIFAYRASDVLHECSLTHYACVLDNCVYVKGWNGSMGRINRGETRPANETEIESFIDKLRIQGFYYNRPNRRVINSITGYLII